MVNNTEQQLDTIFYALSDPTRRAILSRLTRGQCNVSELPNPYDVSKAAISKHLTILHKAKLVDKQKSGRETHCSAKLESLDLVYQLLEELGQFWRHKLDSLEQYLNQNLNEELINEKRTRAASKSRRKKSHSRYA